MKGSALRRSIQLRNITHLHFIDVKADALARELRLFPMNHASKALGKEVFFSRLFRNWPGSKGMR